MSGVPSVAPPRRSRLLRSRPAAAHGAERQATAATFGSVFASAQAGDTVLFSRRNYGNFQGAMKAGEVTVKAQPGATVSMRA